MPKTKEELDVQVNGTRDRKYHVTGSGEQYYAASRNVKGVDMSRDGYRETPKKASRRMKTAKGK